MADFKAGDVVQLKSGGPFMTIDRLYNKDEYAYCWYFTPEGQLKQDESFSVVVLKAVVEEPNTLAKARRTSSSSVV